MSIWTHRGFALGMLLLTLFGLFVAPAWAADLPDAENMPLWLLALFVTLMIFRMQAALRRGKR